MFIIALCFTLTLCIYLALRNWAMGRPTLSSRVEKGLDRVEKHLLQHELDIAKQVLAPLLKRGGKRALLLQAKLLQREKKFEEAYHLLLEATREYPEELLFRLEEGRVLLELGESEEALNALRVCSPILRNEEDYLALAQALFNQGEHAACTELLAPWLEKTENGAIFALAGHLQYESKAFGDAIRFYLKSSEMGYRPHSMLIQLGHAYRRLGNLKEAEQLFRKLMAQTPDDVDAYIGLGSCLQERGHHLKALLIYQASPVWERGDHRLLKQAAYAAFKHEKYGYAEEYFIHVNRSHPSIKHMSYIGFCQEQQQKWQEAEQTYLRAIEHFPSESAGYRALAWLFGVGMTKTLSDEQGLTIAMRALNLHNDLIGWEIVSACEARVGHFERAMQIQRSLASYDNCSKARNRRDLALQCLRNRTPLKEHLVYKMRVA